MAARGPAPRPAGMVPRSEYQDRLCQRRAPQPDFAGLSNQGYAGHGRLGRHAAAAEAAFQAHAAYPPPGGARWDSPAAGAGAQRVTQSRGLEMQLCAQLDGRSGGVAQNPGIGYYASANGGGEGKAPRRVKDNFVNRVVQRCGGSVVRVETEQKVDMPEDGGIFAILFGLQPEKSGKKERRVHGHGSGFCVDAANGIILTNAHVVQGADRVSVTFAGKGPSAECEVLEVDEVIDLACLKIKDKGKHSWPAVPLGSSESCRTGDWAIVLGNPFGLQNTCTLGIISSLDRSTGETGYDWMRHPLLQTDAAVNQGNSGGPILNEEGEVIGMISMRALHGEGIGFAIPSDSIKAALPSLIQRKKVPRSYLGIKMTTKAPGDESMRGRRPGGMGAYVEAVLPRSPAQKAGFQVEDQIVEVAAGASGGRKVRHFDEVQALVRSVPVGTKVTFKVKRAGHSKTLSVEAADIRHLKEEAEKTQGGGRRPEGMHRVIIVP